MWGRHCVTDGAKVLYIKGRRHALWKLTNTHPLLIFVLDKSPRFLAREGPISAYFFNFFIYSVMLSVQQAPVSLKTRRPTTKWMHDYCTVCGTQIRDDQDQLYCSSRCRDEDANPCKLRRWRTDHFYLHCNLYKSAFTPQQLIFALLVMNRWKNSHQCDMKWLAKFSMF